MASCFVVHLLRSPTIGFFLGFHIGVDLLRLSMVGFFVGFRVGKSDGSFNQTESSYQIMFVKTDIFLLLTWMLHHPLKFLVLLILNQ